MKNLSGIILAISLGLSCFNSVMAENSIVEGKAAEDSVIIDSGLSFSKAMAGTKAPREIVDSMAIVDVRYYSTDGKLHQGQLIVNNAVIDDVRAIFGLIEKMKFPIYKAVPIVKYNWSDDASMEDNNTSAFNYRFIAGTKRLSNHSSGRAIDINPYFNPVIYADGRVSPRGAKYDKNATGVFTKDSPIVKEFIKRGWRWGGNFKSFKDYHHFDKAK